MMAYDIVRDAKGRPFDMSSEDLTVSDCTIGDARGVLISVHARSRVVFLNLEALKELRAVADGIIQRIEEVK